VTRESYLGLPDWSSVPAVHKQRLAAVSISMASLKLSGIFGHDLARPYRLRPRAWLWAEIHHRFWLHAFGADREAVELGRELTHLDWSADVRFAAHSGLGSYIAPSLKSADFGSRRLIRSLRRY
jgi:hypothetical protein